MGNEQQHAQTRTTQTTASTNGNGIVVGATNSAAQLTAPRQPIASSLGNEVDRARLVLGYAGDDPRRILEAVNRILTAALETSDAAIAAQLFDLVAAIPDAHIQQRLADTRAQRARSASSTAVSPPAIASARGAPSGPGGHGAITPLNDHDAPTSMESENPGLSERQAARRLADWQVDKTYVNFRDTEMFDLNDLDLFKSLTIIDRNVPLTFRRMMVGQLLGEQSGGKPNRNFGGFELEHPTVRPDDKSGVIWTRTLRTDTITVEQYSADPVRYYDWPLYGHTIKTQLRDPKTRLRGLLAVRWYGARYAYDNWDKPMQSVHAKILGAYHKLRDSPYREHNATAAQAWAGNASEYIDMLEINSKFDARAADAPLTPAPPHDKAIGKMSYNGTGTYKKTVLASVLRSMADGRLIP